MNTTLKDIVIVGGGTAGWMAAASLSHYLQDKDITITLIESSAIGTVGVGEATLPSLREFNAYLGIDELEFIRETQATFKLGIEFKNWQNLNTNFFHPFGAYGAALGGVEFHHHLTRARIAGEAFTLSDFCIPTKLAEEYKFCQPDLNSRNPLTHYNYAFHFNATAYADFLRKMAIKKGVTKIDAKVQNVQLNKNDGFIESLSLDNDMTINGDFFIDCSGFKGLLIEQALKTGYHDWSNWLPCDRAVAVPCEATNNPTSYTRTEALEAGWRWRIPLQHRTGNGHVYSSQYTNDHEATERILGLLDGKALAEPNLLRFTTGKRKKMWHKNCAALGLASGFMEPLESTSIALIQTGISQIHRFLPFNGFNQAEVDEVNRFTFLEFERIRDFLILHYKATARTDTPFWQHCQNLEIPDSLSHKIEVFKARGYFVKHEAESFGDASWLSIYNGMNIIPTGYDHRADAFPLSDLKIELSRMRESIAQNTSQSLNHGEFIKKFCQA